MKKYNVICVVHDGCYPHKAPEATVATVDGDKLEYNGKTYPFLGLSDGLDASAVVLMFKNMPYESFHELSNKGLGEYTECISWVSLYTDTPTKSDITPEQLQKKAHRAIRE